MRIGNLFLMTAFLFVTLCLNGCCCIFLGARQNVTINSVPQGAHVFDGSGAYMGITPIACSLSRQDDYIYLVKEGYQKTRVSTGRSAAWFPFILNIPLFGWLIDFHGSGGVPSYLDGKINAKLLPEGVEAPKLRAKSLNDISKRKFEHHVDVKTKLSR